MFVFTHRCGSEAGFSFLLPFFFSNLMQWTRSGSRAGGLLCACGNGRGGGRSQVKRSNCGAPGVDAGVSRRYPRGDRTGKHNLTAGCHSLRGTRWDWNFPAHFPAGCRMSCQSCVIAAPAHLLSYITAFYMDQRERDSRLTQTPSAPPLERLSSADSAPSGRSENSALIFRDNKWCVYCS